MRVLEIWVGAAAPREATRPRIPGLGFRGLGVPSLSFDSSDRWTPRLEALDRCLDGCCVALELRRLSIEVRRERADITHAEAIGGHDEHRGRYGRALPGLVGHRLVLHRSCTSFRGSARAWSGHGCAHLRAETRYARIPTPCKSFNCPAIS